MTITSYAEGPASRIISLALFVVFLHACGGGSNTQAPTVTANAGANFLANESTPVNLDGTASSSSDNSALTYSWVQIIGINVSLSGADTVTPSFVAPAIDFRQSLTFALQVTSASGASSSDTVAVTINALPIADAGADQSVDEGTTVNLSGTGADSDGTIVSFSWQQENGTAVTITNANIADASFVAPTVTASEVLVFRVTVTDDDGATESDTVTVTVNDIAPPPPPPPPPPGGLDTDMQRVFTQVSFALPVALTQAPGDNSRWFAVEQSGIIRVFDNDQNVVQGDVDVFIDIRGRVSSGGETGLLGMAFHPNFAANGQVYLSYTRGGPLTSVISQFTVDAVSGNLDDASESIILSVLQDFSNHNGGNIVFGPDGFLYIGFGDGGSGGDPNERAQDTNYILGSMVRIDVDSAAPYAIPATNPFSGNTNCVNGTGMMSCPEIYAWGLRNPWRWSFDSQTGELWVGDVGQGAWEEVDRVELGMNYGWDDREGAHCFEPAAGCLMNNVDPITEYDHSVGQSITGGFVYRGTANPNLQGYYVFGDYVSGRVWAVDATSPQGTSPTEIDDTNLNISSFAEGVDGELYAVDHGGGGIYQIIDAP